MIQDKQFCTIKGHEGNILTHICTYMNCDQQSRWVCEQCRIQQLHLHGQISDQHMLDQHTLKDYISKLKHDQFGRNRNEIQQQFITILIQIEKLQSCINDCLLYQKNYDQTLTKLAQESFFNIQTEWIEELLNQDKQIYSILDKNIDSIIMQIQAVQKQLQNQHQIKKEYKCEQYVQLESADCIYTAQISYDEKYLAYGGNEQIVIIYDLKLKQKQKQIKLLQDIYVCQFSVDSQFLYVGCRGGYLYCIDIKDNFKQIYSQKIHDDYITNLVVIQNDQVITCSSQDIIITNIKEKQFIKFQNAHYSCINGIDYDQSKPMIVSASNDQSIKLFDFIQGLIMEKENAHSCEINQVEFIQGNQLLSLDGKCLLRLWQIDFQNSNLILIREINDQHNIMNFRYIEENLILIVCDQYIKFIDESFIVQTQMKHTQGNDVLNRKVKQLKSMNYIIVPGESILQLLILQINLQQ